MLLTGQKLDQLIEDAVMSPQFWMAMTLFVVGVTR